MRLKVWIVVISTLLFFATAKAQINLVPNPSFEIISSCPTNYNQFQLAIGWDTLKNGGGGGGELFNECANAGVHWADVGVPVNIYGEGYQFARTGKSYLNFVLYYSPSGRDYLQSKLKAKLTFGKTYCVSFYVNLNNFSKYGVDEFGVYFDDGSINTCFYCPAIVTPQIKSPTGVFLTDTLNWVKVQGSFIANGTEEYITLGNFRSQAATNKILFNGSASGQSDYNIDDVSVIEQGLPAFAGNDTTIFVGDSAYIGRPYEVGLENNWYVNNVLVGTGIGMWVKPTNNTTYVVEQDMCGVLTYDTVIVNTSICKFAPTPFISLVDGVLTSNYTTGNLWYFNGVLISGANGQTFTPTQNPYQNGDYTLRVTDVNGCVGWSSVYSLMDVGIAGHARNDGGGIRIVPNPTDGLFTIDSEGKGFVEICNVLGELIYKSEIKSKKHEIDLIN